MPSNANAKGQGVITLTVPPESAVKIEELTQAALAARLGVSQNVISETANGKRPISQKTAKRLGEEFDLPYKVFL